MPHRQSPRVTRKRGPLVEAAPALVGAQHAVPGEDAWRDLNHRPRSLAAPRSDPPTSPARPSCHSEPFAAAAVSSRTPSGARDPSSFSVAPTLMQCTEARGGETERVFALTTSSSLRAEPLPLRALAICFSLPIRRPRLLPPPNQRHRRARSQPSPAGLGNPAHHIPSAVGAAHLLLPHGNCAGSSAAPPALARPFPLVEAPGFSPGYEAPKQISSRASAPEPWNANPPISPGPLHTRSRPQPRSGDCN